ncbi:hypothetical protein DL240_00390 [Lujinxingia litoralis]|uniref:Uncharacterized protein n=1 Tax=Lujinxingia litoralis TaxID=2211119 RepID=A0A328C9B9_9DELT|nr:hypothetical protein [Lujinxingia litoralis]RAL24702.1 hypothetical protein DL240_00390 [Lujinxingia litoralis]
MVALSTTACITLTDRPDELSGPFEAIHAGDLPAAEARLAYRNQRHAPHELDAVAHALLDIATCEPLDTTAAVASPDTALLLNLIALEETRRLRLIRASMELPANQRSGWHRGTLHTVLTSRETFRLTPEELPSNLVVWPAHTERWPGERPAPIELEWHCESLGTQARHHDPDAWMARESDATRALLASIDAHHLPELTHHHDALTAHLADLTLARFDQPPPAPAPKRVRTALNHAHAALAAHDALQRLIDLNSREASAGTLARQASLALLLGQTDRASDALRMLGEEAEGPIAQAARYLRLRMLWLEGRFEQAADLALPLPPTAMTFHSAHAYFAVTAQRRAGRTDAFFGAARQALRDRKRGDDPYLGAIYQEVLRELATYQVDERTFEILEEFGPRTHLLERVAELSDVAIDAGRPYVARHLARYLLDQRTDARERPRYHATLALAAFLLDDTDAFVRELRQVTPRPEAVVEVIPAHRRASFFARADAQLARVLRAALPLMAEWGDSPGDRTRRQRWLTLMTEELQRFIRSAPESAVGDELQELYHLAGELLEAHPRGYAERVGREEATALILGTVHVPPAHLAHNAPIPRLSWPPVHSLMIIPRDHGELLSWPTRFDLELDADEQPAEAL